MAVDENAGSVTIYLTIRPEVSRVAGKPEVHGGVVAALIDITGHAAIASKLKHSVATIDLRVDYLRIAAGTELRAVGTIVKVGRTIGIVDIRLTDDQDRLVAIGRTAYLCASV
ncbi:MAG: PaaI family thioesterase [Xanthobacteraceae bacterium]